MWLILDEENRRRAAAAKRAGEPFEELGPEWFRWELADKKGRPLGRGMANRYMNGQRRPDLETAVRIQKRFGIEPKLFFEAPAPTARPTRKAA